MSLAGLPAAERRGSWPAVLTGVLVVFAVAFALRAGHLALLRSAWESLHLFSIARGDAALHWDEANEILDGDFWLRDRLFWKGPGYSYFLAGLMALFGRSPGTLRWPLALLGAINCAALVLLARRALPPAWSTLAGLLAAVHGLLILYDGELFLPTLLIALDLAMLGLLARPTAGSLAHAAAGCLAGAAALVHPVHLLPAAALALCVACRCRRRALAFALACAASIAPVTLTNALVRGQPLLISWNGGINVYAGNQPCFDQYSGNRTNAWVRILETPVDAGIGPEQERDRLYYRLAARQVRDSPFDALALLLRKTVILFSPVEYASNIGLYELREHSAILAATLGRWGPLWWPFGVLAPFSIVGAILMLRDRAPLTGLLGAWSLGLALTIVLSFNTARYRAPLVFFGCIAAAYAVEHGWRAWRQGRHARLARGAGAVLASAVAVALAAESQHELPLPLEWEESVALTNMGAPERAEPFVRAALARAPDDAPLHLAASGFFRKRGDSATERALLERMLRMPDLEPDLISVGRHALARSLADDGRIEDARREIEAALAVGVDDTEWRGQPYYRLGLGPLTACWLRLEAAGFELDAGDPARARALMERVRRDCPVAGRLETGLAELEFRSILATPRL